MYENGVRFNRGTAGLRDCGKAGGQPRRHWHSDQWRTNGGPGIFMPRRKRGAVQKLADISREAPVLIAGPTASGKSALAVEATLTHATGTAEREATLVMLDRKKRPIPITLGPYHPRRGQGL